MDRWRIFPLRTHIPFTVAAVTKMAKAADPWASGLAIFHTSGEGWFIWGMVDQVVHLSMALVQENDGSYTPPGLFHALVNGPADITVFRGGSYIARLVQDAILEEQNYCLLEGAVSNQIDRWIRPLWIDLFRSVGDESLYGWKPWWKQAAKEMWVKTLSRVLINIQRTRHGGALLFTPNAETDSLNPKYKLNYGRIAAAMRSALYGSALLSHARDVMEWQRLDGQDSIPHELYAEAVVAEGEVDDGDAALTGAVRFISSMAGVDGLILLTPDFVVRGFGVEILTTKPEVRELHLTRASNVEASHPISPQTFGTRHRSMARFCTANPDSLGFVVSQDGDIRAVKRIGSRTYMFDNVKVLSTHDDDFKRKLAGRVAQV